MKGVQEYKTKAGWHVVRVHYTADPAKDPSTPKGADWLKQALIGVKHGMSSSGWQKEMEIDWRARSGDKVFPELEQMKDSVLVKPFEIPNWWEIKGGYDYGKRNPFSYHDYAIDGDRNIYAAFEAYGTDYEIPIQADLIKKSPYWGRTHVRFADPSIWAEDEHNVKRDGYTSKQQIFSECGIYFVKGRQDDIAAAERLEAMLFDLVFDVESQSVIRRPKEAPQFRIFANCIHLWDELINLRWADFSPKVEEERGKKETIRQIDNHAFDDLKYFLLHLPKESVKPIPHAKDPALPLAGELIGVDEEKTPWEKWNAR